MKRLLILISFLLLLGTIASAMEVVQINSLERQSVTVNVLESADDFTIVEVLLNHYQKGLIEIDGEEYILLNIPSQATRLEKGNPELPVVGRALMIPPRSKMHVEVLEKSFSEFSGQVVPSKGSFPRSINPAEVPFEFSDVYRTDGFFPENLIELNDPFIMREIRGIGFRVSPFDVNPVQGMIRAYERIVFKVYAEGIDTINVMDARATRVTKDFVDVYKNHFINYDQVKSRNPNYLEEQGSMLVICFPTFMETAQLYVDWKNQKGIKTVMVPSTEAGTTHQHIKAFIENYWEQNPELAYIQLIGDSPQIPTLMHSAGAVYGTGGSDPSYVMLVGNDLYPDLFIGRFSAENIAHLYTQIERTIYYERDIVDGEWLNKAFGLAGNESGGHNGERDDVHMELLRQRLLTSNTYSHVDAIYQPNQSLPLVNNALNEGRSFANYISHGDIDRWTFNTGWAFTNTHVNALTNDWKLPHIVSVACLNGHFTPTAPVFAEHWLRATNTNSGAPTGAIAVFMSSISQPWVPPMYAQDIIADLHIAASYKTIGGLYYNGTIGMLTAFSHTDTNHTIRTWHIFGDASLMVRNTPPVAMEIEASEVILMGMTDYVVNVNTPGALAALYRPDTKQLISSAYVNSDNEAVFVFTEPFTEPCDLLLTITAYNKITAVRQVSVLPNEGPYLVFNSYSFAEGHEAVYDTTPTINITVFNIGTEDATEVSFTLISEDPFVNIIEAQATISMIDSEEYFTISDIFSFEISKYVPNLHEADFILRAENDFDSWEMKFKVTVYAPNISFLNAFMTEPGNGSTTRLNPGETVDIHIPFRNTGNAASSIGNVVMYSVHPQVIVSENVYFIEPIEANQTSYAIFTVTADEDIESGSRVRFGFFAEFSSASLQSNNDFPIGLLIEDFSTGDFSAFEWENNSPSPWEIDSANTYEGDFAIASGTVTHNQTSTISITRELDESGTISFWYKVSSEANRDFLQFYLNNAILGQWSGERDWAYISFNIPAGNQQFRWVYRKDASGSAGQDKAWVDYITFPLSGGTEHSGPFMYVNVDVVDFSKAEIDEVSSTEFKMVNFGNEALIGSISVPDGFTINEAPTINFNIPPNSNAAFDLVFRPTEKVNYSGNMVILSNDRFEEELLIEIKADLVSNTFIEIPNLTTELYGNYPNPFNPETTISFSLSKPQHVEITIYNIRGQRVKNLINGDLPAGIHDIVWDGKDSQNRSVASGIYFYRFHTPETTKTNRMVLMK